ncbi:MAG TPA: J domain-containing protein [Pyrinomonadaceae bacterium]|nr:J domain-containing protein [Pyrinomonadaceae bacterium]
MVNYYETLKVSPKASRTEIRSAYRRLARKLHPDKNNGSEETARAFAAIAEAYEVLSSPRERATYDKRILQAQYNGSTNGDSVFTSSNSHARRWRQMVYEHRYNEIIDRMIAEERRESMALQRIIFPTVALFVSTLVAAILKPHFFTLLGVPGMIILGTLFVVGMIHLIGRVREAMERYAYHGDEIHDSIIESEVGSQKMYSRFVAGSFLVFGVLTCFGIGLFIGSFIDLGHLPRQAGFWFSNPEFLFYPPIFVLLVDLMHSIASRTTGPSGLDVSADRQL